MTRGLMIGGHALDLLVRMSDTGVLAAELKQRGYPVERIGL